MKLYDTKLAPNPRRVRIFLAEKGIDVPIEEISIMKGEHKTPDYRKLSPLAQVPTLVLDDGQTMTESITICRYFEALHPDPPLFGADPVAVAMIDMWQRRIELLWMMSVAMHFRHCHPAMAQLENQNKEWGEDNKTRVLKMMKFFDGQIADREFIAGDFSVADITALCTIDFGIMARITIPDEHKNLKAWHERLSARPSAQAGM